MKIIPILKNVEIKFYAIFSMVWLSIFVGQCLQKENNKIAGLKFREAPVAIWKNPLKIAAKSLILHKNSKHNNEYFYKV